MPRHPGVAVAMRHLLWLLLLAAVALPAVQAQEPLEPALRVTGPLRAAIPHDAEATLEASWSLHYASPAEAAAALGDGNARLDWSLDCGGNVSLAPTQTPVEHVAGQSAYAGTARLAVRAAATAPGVEDLPCTLTATLATTGSEPREATRELPLRVAYRGELLATAPTNVRAAGPQKQIPYDIEVTNNGNAPTVVTPSLAQVPTGKWHVVLPDAAVVQPGETIRMVVMVATPYETGFVTGATGIALRLEPSAVQDPEAVGPAVDVALKAQVKGFYVPGPGVAAAVAALAVALLAARRH